MPVQLERTSEEGAFCHVYNKGIEGTPIFNDQKDYEVFLDFLKGYLTPPDVAGAKKTAFTVNGKTYQGVPHQPKNHYNNVELLAYGLSPTHFHLLLHQVTENSIENLMRSLLTRYSIYFNKKYQHAGTIFAGPYKSLKLKNSQQILLLTRYLHSSNDYASSYPEYIGVRDTDWIKPKEALSLFEDIREKYFDGTENYKKFVENYQPTSEQLTLLSEVVLEKDKKRVEPQLERSLPVSEPAPDLSSTLDPIKPKHGFVAFGGVAAVFLILLGVGIRNIDAYQAKVTPSKSVLSESTSATPIATPIPSSESQTMLTVRLANSSGTANIRREANLNSEIIATVNNMEQVEAINLGPEWDEVRLKDGTTGYISSLLVQNITN